jgi:hypothetical protein
MKVGTFVYKPDTTLRARRDSIEYPITGQALQGTMSIVVRSDSPPAEMCVLEYSLGSDSAPGPWQMVGPIPQSQGRFIGTWASDSALLRAQMPYGTPCALKPIILGRDGRNKELLLKTVINEPPKRVSRGCGCGQ